MPSNLVRIFCFQPLFLKNQINKNEYPKLNADEQKIVLKILLDSGKTQLKI